MERSCPASDQKSNRDCHYIGLLAAFPAHSDEASLPSYMSAKFNYTSTVWLHPLKEKGHVKALGTVQRTGLIRVLSGPVAPQRLEVENYVKPTWLQFQQRAANVIARIVFFCCRCNIYQLHERPRVRLNPDHTAHSRPFTCTKP